MLSAQAVLGVAVQWGLALAAFPLVLLALCVGSAHDLGRRRTRIVYGGAIAAGVVALVGGALIPARVGSASLGAVLVVAALLSALVLHWTARLG